MNKKTLSVLLVVFIALLIGGTIIYFKTKKKSTPLSPTYTIKETGKEVKLLQWEDPAGFKFSYPESIEIDSHEEDSENYAHLELTSPDREGKIIILMSDTNYSDIESWAKKESGEGQVIDTELAGSPAKKVAFTHPERILVAAIDIDVLIAIEMTPDEKNFWQGIFNKILASFELIPLEGETTPIPRSDGGGVSSGGGGQIIEEAEEVIE